MERKGTNNMATGSNKVSLHGRWGKAGRGESLAHTYTYKPGREGVVLLYIHITTHMGEERDTGIPRSINSYDDERSGRKKRQQRKSSGSYLINLT